MFIDTEGHGPPLVLVPGWAMHGGIFAPLRAALAARFTVHVVDLPGHGRSDEREGPLDLRDSALRIADAVPGAIWIGWSLGGLVALEAALESPLQVRGLVLIAASPRFLSAPDWPHGVEHAVFDAFGQDLARDWRGTLDRFLALECVGSDCARSDLRTLRAHVFDRGEPALHVLDDGLKILADTDLRPHLPELECPSLWLAGARDRLVPWQAMEAAAARAPGGSFVRIDGGGHAPFIGHPDRVLHAIDDWVARALPA
jgi:pimeloyl-[acyl-carrier protein] methyl ester esterase